MAEPPTTDTVLMVRPAAFGHNAETAGTNAFVAPHAGELSDEAQRLARREFDALAGRLDDAGVRTVVVEDTPEPQTPDAVFPNNWVSFHGDGTVVLYPMLAPSRRTEVRPDVVALVERALGVRWARVLDLTPLAERGAFLEGTGSLVLDRPARVAFACRSPRTTDEALAAFAGPLGYRVHAFHAHDQRGHGVYHTNVMMALGADFAVCCLGCVPDDGERDRLRRALGDGGRELIEISVPQRDRFAGNVLALRTTGGEPRVVLSARALASLDPPQRRALERHGGLVAPDLQTIEDVAGGGARCMLAEVFLPAPGPDPDRDPGSGQGPPPRRDARPSP
jgi:hypothetical protein